MERICLDIETNGLADFHEITEISILNCSSMEQVTWDIKIKYPQRSSKDALLITGKTAQELATRGRYIEQVIPEINEFIQSISKDPDDIIAIGHNVSFDRRFLENKWKANNSKFPVNYYLCTMEMSKRFSRNILNIKNKMSFSLSNMLKIASIKEIPGQHQSTIDVQNCYRLYMYMKSRGMPDTEFIKLSPSLMQNLVKTAKPNKKIKLDDEIENVLSSADYPMDDFYQEQEDENEGIP